MYVYTSVVFNHRAIVKVIMVVLEYWVRAYANLINLTIKNRNNDKSKI